MSDRVIDLQDLTATETLGRKVGELLFPGAVVALVGPLGAGKTHLARAIAEGLGVPDGRIVTSPTFVLMQQYQGRLLVQHVDVYRLAGAAAFTDLGIEEQMEGDDVFLIEWADRIVDFLPLEHLQIRLEVVAEQSRRAYLGTTGPRYVELLSKL